jgi:murein DD-endopeptidase MepM/ murein hydrolase activator NlpD
MKTSLLALALSGLGLFAPEQPVPGAPAIRFCPTSAVRAYPLDDIRGLRSLLLQNVAVIQNGATPATITEVDIQLLRSGQIIDERRLTPDDLRRFAEAGRDIQSAGMLKLFSFQFCGTDMVPGSVKLGGPLLNQNEAMIVLQQAFAYSGDRDTVRVRVQAQVGGRDVEAAAILPIRTAPSAHAYRFPLRGTWYVAAGPSFHTAHRWAIMEEFALDIVKLGSDGVTHQRNGTQFEDYFAYGADVVAAADGRVVSVVTDQTEDARAMRQPGESAEAYLDRLRGDQATRLAKGTTDAIVGNAVVVDHGDDEFSMYLHLQPGSVRVKAGDRVEAGQVIGKLGSSGNSTEPHLHFQVCNTAQPMTCAGVPVRFSNTSLPLADMPRLLQSGDVVIARER